MSEAENFEIAFFEERSGKLILKVNQAENLEGNSVKYLGNN